MIQKGMALRYTEDYLNEIELAKRLGFTFFQIWFYNGALSVNTLQEPKEDRILEHGFPVIIHAAFDINDFELHGQRLLELLDYFSHNEVIVHPVCTSEKITDRTVHKLSEKLNFLCQKLTKRQIKLYVENNSVIDGFFNTVSDLRIVFDSNADIGFLLDLAHINDYNHLKEIVDMRFPDCIHIADKHFGVQHEHLPIGKGDMDFDMIFNKILTGYSGKIILEAVESLEDIQESKRVIDRIFPTV